MKSPVGMEFTRNEQLPPRNESVIIKTEHFRRLAFLDFSGVWRWTENRETVAEQVLAWESAPFKLE